MRQKEINKLAKENFENGMDKALPHIKYSGYVRSAQNMECECGKCGYKWKRSPNQFYRDGKWRDCPNCVKNKKNSNVDNSLLRNEILNKYPNIDILTDTIRTRKDSILFVFKNDNEKILYKMKISQMLKDGERTFARYWDTEIYKKELFKVNPDIECIEEFNHFNNKIMHYCKIHKIKFLIDPAHALRGHGCHQCKLDKIGDAKRKSEDEYIEELHKIHPYIDLNDTYISVNKPTSHKCKRCGFEWNPYPLNLLNGSGCPICADVTSRGERMIISILNKNKIDYIPQFRLDDCRSKKPLPFDFYIPNKKVCIEFQGKQHYQSVQFGGISEEEANKNLIENRERDLIKFNYCRDNDIHLIVIPYWDFNNIEDILWNENVL